MQHPELGLKPAGELFANLYSSEQLDGILIDKHRENRVNITMDRLFTLMSGSFANNSS
jgi:hypothetical protein